MRALRRIWEAVRRSTALRLAALFVAAFALAATLAAGAAVWIVRAEVMDAARADIAGHHATVARRIAAAPDRAMPGALTPGRVVAVFDVRGRFLAGTSGVPPVTGWHRVDADALAMTPLPGRDEPDELLLFGRTLTDGRHLVVGAGLDLVEEVTEALAPALFGSVLAAIPFAIGGAGLIAWRTRARLKRLEDALSAYAAGDLSRRVPIRHGAGETGDDLDRVGATVNAALVRIEALVAAMRQVTSDAAHDLKTPMTRLRNLLEDASREADPRPAIERALDETDAVIATFEALLRIAQVEGGARDRFGTVDLSDVLETVADAYGPDAEEAGGRIDVAVEPHLAVAGDRDLLVQAVANLVENALRHAGGDGAGATVRVEGRRANGAIEAAIADDGPGVPAGERARVMQRFVRLEASRTTPGTGLGLALVDAVARLHGADLRLEDAAPGRTQPGLRAVLRFPGALNRHRI